MAHVERLTQVGVSLQDIGIITPYNGQAAALRALRGEGRAGLEISSVDGFQGGLFSRGHAEDFLQCRHSCLLRILTFHCTLVTQSAHAGREKEAIVISMVRSNSKGEVGFLSDHRRMNVAVTRARRHCALICDSETVQHDPFLGRLIAYFEAHGDLMSAEELRPS